jgi:hypothetical protein
VRNPCRWWFHLLVTLPTPIGDVALAERALLSDVIVTTGRHWCPAEPPAPFLRLPYAGTHPSTFTKASAASRGSHVRLSCTVCRALMLAVVLERFLGRADDPHRVAAMLLAMSKAPSRREAGSGALAGLGSSNLSVLRWRRSYQLVQQAHRDAGDLVDRLLKRLRVDLGRFRTTADLPTYCSAALRTSSCVAGGSKLCSGRMLRHIPTS